MRFGGHPMKHEYRFSEKRTLKMALYGLLGGVILVTPVFYLGWDSLLLMAGAPLIVISLIFISMHQTCILTEDELTVCNLLGIVKVRMRLENIVSASPSQVVMSFGMMYFLRVKLRSEKEKDIMGFSKGSINQITWALKKLNPDIRIENHIDPNNWLETSPNPPGT